MKEKIIAASQEARLRPDYPPELHPDYVNQSLCDKYLNNYHENHLNSNGSFKRYYTSQCIRNK